MTYLFLYFFTMYLYKGWLRYKCSLDTIQESRKEIVFKMLQVINDLNIDRDVLLEKLPLRFWKEGNKKYTGYVLANQWPYMESILLTEQINWPGSHPSSIRIFKDAMRIMNNCNWSYSYEYSYTSFLARNFGIDLPEPVHLERKMILVPDIFLDVVIATVVGEEKCQAI